MGARLTSAHVECNCRCFCRIVFTSLRLRPSQYIIRRTGPGYLINYMTGYRRRWYKLYQICPIQSVRKEPFTGKKRKLFQCAPPGTANFPRLESGVGAGKATFCGRFDDDEPPCESELDYLPGGDDPGEFV